MEEAVTVKGRNLRSMRSARWFAIAMFLCVSLATVSVQQPALDNQPGRRWSEEQLKAAITHVAAGRKLTPKTWPNGARVAVGLTFTVNNTIVNVANADDGLVQLSGGEFGAIVGLPRVLALLKQHDVPATFFVPGAAAVIEPTMLPQILAGKRHEVALNGWADENLSTLPASEEERLFNKSLEYITKATGKRPVGARGPFLQHSANTAGLMKKAGLLYDSTLQALDEPYEVVLDGKPSGLIALPPSRYLDDYFTLSAPRFGPSALPSPALIFEVYRDDFDVAYDEGTMFLLTLHPHLIGMRSRIGYLDELIRYMKSQPGVWFATGEEIARYVAEQQGMTKP